MSTFSLRRSLLLVGLLFWLVGCAPNVSERPAERPAVVELSNSGTERVIQQTPVPANDANGADHPGMAGGEVFETMEPLDSSAWGVYADTTYSFQIAHPQYYARKTVQEAGLSPQPVAIIQFLDTQSRAVTAPPIFWIRVYENDAQQLLNNWLTSNGLMNQPDLISETYTGKYFSGIKVSSTNYVSPGESIYTARGKWVFQFVPVGNEANAMLDTFKFTD